MKLTRRKKSVMKYLLCSHVSDVSDFNHKIFARSSPAVLLSAYSNISNAQKIEIRIKIKIIIIIKKRIKIITQINQNCCKNKKIMKEKLKIKMIYKEIIMIKYLIYVPEAMLHMFDSVLFVA